MNKSGIIWSSHQQSVSFTLISSFSPLLLWLYIGLFHYVFTIASQNSWLPPFLAKVTSAGVSITFVWAILSREYVTFLKELKVTGWWIESRTIWNSQNLHQGQQISCLASLFLKKVAFNSSSIFETCTTYPGSIVISLIQNTHAREMSSVVSEMFVWPQ